MRGKTVQVKCERCKKEFNARVADRKRGWGKFCSKSCKASEQESRTGQYYNYLGSGVDKETYDYYANESGGIPQFSSSGEYEGCTVDFSDESFDKHGVWEQ